jgi:hypothetical protein
MSDKFTPLKEGSVEFMAFTEEKKKTDHIKGIREIV